MSQDPLIFNGKKYISSRRAASISGYTSDYVGQLARSKKIPSRMVGRNRFIDESALLEYIHSGDVKSGSSDTYPGQETGVGNGLSVSEDFNDNNHINDNYLQNKGFSKDEDNSDEISSIRDQERMAKRVGNSKNTSFETKVSFVASLAVVIIMGVFLNLGPGRDGLNTFVQSFSGDNNFSQNQTEQLAKVELAEVKNFLNEVDESFLGYLSRIDMKVILFAQSFRDKVLSLFGDNEVTDTEVVQVDNSTSQNQTSEEVSFNVDEEKLRQYVRQIMLSEQDVFAPGRSYNGIVTLPSTGDSERDRQIIEDVKNSFSDDVVVELDSSNTFGTIKPVFRNKDNLDESYMFLLVPVN